MTSFNPVRDSITTVRAEETCRMPESAGTRETKSGSRCAGLRVLRRLGVATYRSARSVVSSQFATDARKLAIITPTPIVVAMASIRAAMATPVRESDASMPRSASRAVGPSRVPMIALEPRVARRTSSGAVRVMPISAKNSATNAVTSPRGDVHSTISATARSSTPAAARRGVAARACASSTERVSVRRGGVTAASRAGTITAASEARMPSAAPLTSGDAATVSVATLTTK